MTLMCHRLQGSRRGESECFSDGRLKVCPPFPSHHGKGVIDVQDAGQQPIQKPDRSKSRRRRWARLRRQLKAAALVAQLVLVAVRCAYVIKSWLS